MLDKTVMTSAQNKQIAAFFDVDDTIVVGTNTLLLYIKYLVRHGMMSRWQVAKGVLYSALHKLNLINVERLLDKMAEPYKNRSHSDMQDLTEDWFASDVIPHLSKDAKDMIQWHKDQGHVTVILSSATQYVCHAVRDFFKMDASLNTEVIVENGILTGQIRKPICYKEGKVHHALAFAKEHNIDFQQCYFYTDSVSDLPMLERVGSPRIINPDPLLKRHAIKRNWPVQIWSEKINLQTITANSPQHFLHLLSPYK